MIVNKQKKSDSLCSNVNHGAFKLSQKILTIYPMNHIKIDKLPVSNVRGTWSTESLIIYSDKSDIFLITKNSHNQIKQISKYIIEQDCYYHYLIDTNMRCHFEPLWSSLLDYKQHSIQNRFNATMTTKININSDKKRYILFILDVREQIIHKIIFRDGANMKGTVCSASHCGVDLGLPEKESYLCLLKLSCGKEENTNNVYGIALDIKDMVYYNVIYTDYVSNCNQIGSVGKKASDLNATIIKHWEQKLRFKSHIFTKYYINYIRTKNRTYLLHWTDMFKMKLITTLNCGDNIYDVNVINIKPFYSHEKLLELTDNLWNEIQLRPLTALDLTIYSKLIFFIPPLYDDNFFIAFFDIHIFNQHEIYLYSIRTKEMIKCRNHKLLNSIKESRINYYDQDSSSLHINIIEQRDIESIIAGFIRTVTTNIPKVIDYVVRCYCYIQRICICRGNFCEIVSFDVDQLFFKP